MKKKNILVAIMLTLSLCFGFAGNNMRASADKIELQEFELEEKTLCMATLDDDFAARNTH